MIPYLNLLALLTLLEVQGDQVGQVGQGPSNGKYELLDVTMAAGGRQRTAVSVSVSMPPRKWGNRLKPSDIPSNAQNGFPYGENRLGAGFQPFRVYRYPAETLKSKYLKIKGICKVKKPSVIKRIVRDASHPIEALSNAILLEAGSVDRRSRHLPRNEMDASSAEPYASWR